LRFPMARSGDNDMKVRLYRPNHGRDTLIRVIRDPRISLERLWRAFWSLPEPDRDCLRHVARLISLET